VQTLGATGQAYISDTTHINYTWGVGTDGTDVWIAEESGHRALKFDGSNGNFIGAIGNAGWDVYDDTSIWRVSDVTVDASGNVWLADNQANRVLKFNASGEYVSTMGENWNWGSDNSHFGLPASVAFDSNSNIYISDGVNWGDHDVGNHRIQVFDSNGTYLNTIGTTGTPGSGNDQFYGPRHIAIYSDTLYVADSCNQRVQIFNISNPVSPTYVATIGITGQSGYDSTHLGSPSGVAVDTNYIYVADTFNNRVQIFNRSTRAYVATIGSGEWGSRNDAFKAPFDVAVDSAGNIYVADFWNMRVQQFNSSRNYVRTYGVPGVPYVTDGYHHNYPRGVAVATDGSQYIVEEYGRRLVKLNAAGVFQWAVGEPGVGGNDNAHFHHNNSPSDVAVDTAGRVYVTDTGNNRIQIFSLSGSYSTTLGSYGTGNTQFDCPNGLTIAPNGFLYVADTCNHRVQIFDSNRNYVATLGVTGVSGSDNRHFNGPLGVSVDASGNIYVADGWNHRVQKFNSSRVWQMTLGATGQCGSDFDDFCEPSDVTVDASGRIYVADRYNHRVQVFSGTGEYLTTIAGSRGTNTGQFREPTGVDVDRTGNVYVADHHNQRIQKFAPGVPGWRQMNINGFGDRQNQSLALDIFNGQLYAGVSNTSKGAQIWRSSDGRTWSPTSELGFGLGTGVSYILDTIVFDGKLYVGTGWRDRSARIWRTSDGTTWELVADGGFGNTRNDGIGGFVVFKDALYAIVSTMFSGAKGFDIWRSSTGNSGDWTRVVSDGLGSTDRTGCCSGRAVFDGFLYGGFADSTNGATIWRTNNGTDWSQVNTPGFGDPKNKELTAGAVFNGRLYFGTRNDITGAQLWRLTNGTTWESILTNGFGNPQNIKIEALIVWRDGFYAVTYNIVTGTEVWRSSDGTNWVQIGQGGFGDSNNVGPLWSDGIAVFNEALYLGTWNNANGGELWLYLSNRTYLPVVLRQ